MQETTNGKMALAAAWAMLPTLGGALTFFALGKYNHVLITAVTGCISLGMLNMQHSRRIFIACIVLSIVAGIVCHQCFSKPDGNITDVGIMVLLLPMMAVNGFLVLRIYLAEKSKEI